MTDRPAIRQVVLTGSFGGIVGLSESLREMGLGVIERPLIQFAPPDDWAPFDRALEEIDSFKAIAITSPRAAVALIQRLPRKPSAVPVWTTGAVTAMLLGGAMTTVHIAEALDAEGAAEAVAEAILRAGVGSPVFFPCGALHRPGLVFCLQAAGVTVRTEICYQTKVASPAKARGACTGSDLVVVASPSVAQLLAESIDPTSRPLLLAAGRTTAAAAEVAGWPADAIARRPTVGDIAAAFATLQPS